RAPPPTAAARLSLHDALPICSPGGVLSCDGLLAFRHGAGVYAHWGARQGGSKPLQLAALYLVGGGERQRVHKRNIPGNLVIRQVDRESTRLNSSHVTTSYAVS